MARKKIKVGYWTIEEFRQKFPDFDAVPVCDNWKPRSVARFANVSFPSTSVLENN